MNTGPRILVAPLDWGLGHATRCIPIIGDLIAAGCTPIVGASGGGLALLRQHFPAIESFEFEGYAISYPKNGNMAWHFIKQSGTFLKSIRKEQEQLDGLIQEHRLDGLISDNRFGLFTDKIPCVYITHQINIQAPAFKKALYKWHRQFMDHYTAVWVPDFAGSTNLGGVLSHGGLPPNAAYIGSLSRFEGIQQTSSIEPHTVLISLSGPEPQRTAFEEFLLPQLENLPYTFQLVRGLPGQQSKPIEMSKAEVHNHLPTASFAAALHKTEIVVSRPGYSTLMDLSHFQNKKVIVVPTAGQTEQEYLSRLLSNKNVAVSEKQKHFDLGKALKSLKQCNAFPTFRESGELRKEAMQQWLQLL